MSYSSDRTKRIEKHGGSIYYVATDGDDGNTGTSPTEPLLTIGAAILLLATGDAISVKGGTYTEVGLDLDTDSATLLLSSGVILAPATGDVLTISGSYCDVIGHAELLPAADVHGVVISGDGCKLSGRVDEGAFVILGALSLTCVCVTGDKSELERINATGVKVGGKVFDLQGDNVAIRQCGGYGSAQDTYGFFIEGSVGLIEDCFSLANALSGFYFDTGAAFWTVKDSMSGAGDGRWGGPAGTDQMWDGFSFDEQVHARTDFSIEGGAPGSMDLFEITGAVQIFGIRADVETILAADVGNLKYTMWDGTASTDITDIVASASAPLGSLFVKEKKSTDALTLYSSDTAKLIEEVDLKRAVFGINAKEGATTTIRITWSGNAATGILHHHIAWEPLTEAGFVRGL